MARVLVIEDERTLRTTVARGLAKIPGVEVVEAATMEEAVRVLDQGPPSVILSDIDLPDRSGIEILGELGRRGMKVPVIFVSAYLRAYRSQIPPHADVEIHEKPVALDELRNLVRRRIGRVSSPPPSPFGVIDYFQLACMGRRSVIIDVTSPQERSRVVVYKGDPWAAHDDIGNGVDAFRRILFNKAGSVDCKTLREDPGPRNLESQWESLVLDAARIEDEERKDTGEPARLTGRPNSRTTGPMPSLEEILTGAKASTEIDILPKEIPTLDPAKPVSVTAEEPAPEESQEERAFAEIWDRGINAMLDRDHARALEAFLAASELRPNDRKVIANLERLKALGWGPERLQNQAAAAVDGTGTADTGSGDGTMGPPSSAILPPPPLPNPRA
jgi:CheY-like chemotaxis protein